MENQIPKANTPPMADWSQLPRDLIAKISIHLETSSDRLRFRCVCTTWRSSAIAPDGQRFSSDFPVIPDGGVLNTISGFRLSIRSIFHVSLPYPRNQTDPNPSWLIKIDQEEDNRKHLFFNPFARSFVPNGSIRVLDFMNLRVRDLGQEFVLQYLNHNAMNDLYMEKVVFLCKDQGFLLLTIHVSGKLAILGSNETKWSVIEKMVSPYDDVIAYKENFYAVDNTGRTVIVRFELNSKKLVLVADSVYGGDKKYLVESDGDLLLVDMYLSTDTEEEGIDFLEEDNQNYLCCTPERAVKFKVFRMDWMEKTWVEVNSLADRLLFIGDNCTFSMSTSELKTTDGLSRGNCVIYGEHYDCLSTENEKLANNSIGVFYLETGSIVPLRKCAEYSRLFWPPPQWLNPTMVQENYCEGQSSQPME